jgi:hypothetical protein
VEEMNVELLKKRGSHVRKKCLQVSTDTPKCKQVKVRKCNQYGDQRIQPLPLEITIWNRGGKPYLKVLQLGQEQKCLQQMIWMGICGWVDPLKDNANEANSSYKKT